MTGRHRTLTAAISARENTRSRHRRVAVIATVASLTAIIAAALAAFLGGATSGGGQVSARAVADTVNPTCAALRAQFGAGWPCISVPNYTSTTIPTAPIAPGGPTDGSGVHMGVDAGPGPGVGNGTPIVPVPGQSAGSPPSTAVATVPATTSPSVTAGGKVSPPAVAASAPPPALQNANTGPRHDWVQAQAVGSDTSGGLTPLQVNLLAVASAGLVLGGGLAMRGARGASPATAASSLPVSGHDAIESNVPGRVEVAGPTGPGAPPQPGDPDYQYWLDQSPYRQNFWQAWNESPIGKEIHHAIEQQILNKYPGVFDEVERHGWTNLRGIWQSMAPALHQGALSRAWRAIYDELKSQGILPPVPQTMSGEPAELLRKALIYWAFVIDLLFGQFFTPTPEVVDSPEFEDLLRSLGLTDDEISRFHDLTYRERLDLLQRLLDGYTGDVPAIIRTIDDERLTAPLARPGVTRSVTTLDPNPEPSAPGTSGSSPQDTGNSSNSGTSDGGAGGGDQSGGDGANPNQIMPTEPPTLPPPPQGFHWSGRMCTPDNPNGARVLQPDDPNTNNVGNLPWSQLTQIPDPATPVGPSGTVKYNTPPGVPPISGDAGRPAPPMNEPSGPTGNGGNEGGPMGRPGGGGRGGSGGGEEVPEPEVPEVPVEPIPLVPINYNSSNLSKGGDNSSPLSKGGETT